MAVDDREIVWLFMRYVGCSRTYFFLLRSWENLDALSKFAKLSCTFAA